MNTRLQKRWDSQENIKFLLAEQNDTFRTSQKTGTGKYYSKEYSLNLPCFPKNKT